MGLILSGAAAGGGEALERAGAQAQKAADALDLEKMKEELIGARQKALQESAQTHDVKMKREIEQPFQRELQTSAQTFTSGENKLGRDLQRELQDAGFTHAEIMQDTALEAAAKEHSLNREVTREGQKIHAAQVGIMAQGAALDRQIKMMEIKNKMEVEALRKSYATETDPAKKSQIAENIQMLTGKDNDSYLPVPLKDEMGGITGYQIFDKKRGSFVDQKPGGAAATGAKWDNGTGNVMIDGRVVGKASNETEARALIAKTRKPAAGATVPPVSAPVSDGSKTPGEALRTAIANAYNPNDAIGGLIGSKKIPPEENFTAP